MSKAILQINNLSAGYGGRPVLQDISLTVAADERIALIGPNGCGKSTLLRAITAETTDNSGTILHKGQSITTASTDVIIRRGIAYLRQRRNIFPGLTVAENIDLASWGDGEDRELVVNCFPVLKGRERVRAGLLSGGERQALALAMVLIRNASLLLLDEPLAGLSQKNSAGILDGIAAIQAQRRFAMIVVEHRLRQIQPHVDRVIVMVRGKIAEDTRDISILESPHRLEKHYMI